MLVGKKWPHGHVSAYALYPFVDLVRRTGGKQAPAEWFLRRTTSGRSERDEREEAAAPA